MNTETKNLSQFLLQGLESVTNEAEFRKASNKVFEDAFTVVFEAQKKGTLRWIRSGPTLKDWQAEATVKNAQGKEITIPIYLFIKYDGDGGGGPFLTLGERGENAPCRNYYEAEVNKLFTSVTGIR